MFMDDFDRTRFCAQLERTLQRREWRCLAFILMPTHYHLLLEVLEDDLQGGMQGLNWAYARRFNARHDRKGHFVGERYYCGPVTRDRHLLRALRYIAMNPVKAGLCRSPADWYWGSYRGAVGLDIGFPFVDPTPLRRYFGSDRARANEVLRAFIDE
jgi:REP element-mobilizing transposase RayT